jgi:thioredoxin-related protein
MDWNPIFEGSIRRLARHASASFDVPGLAPAHPNARSPARARPMSQKRSHPHFDDKGSLDWHTSWASALEAAAAQGRKIFVEYGREQCSQCRALVQSVVPKPEVAQALDQRFIALAVDCDDAEPEVEALAARLEAATMLPFVLFAEPTGEFLEGHSGAIGGEELLRILDRIAPPPAVEDVEQVAGLVDTNDQPRRDSEAGSTSG